MDFQIDQIKQSEDNPLSYLSKTQQNNITEIDEKNLSNINKLKFDMISDSQGLNKDINHMSQSSILDSSQIQNKFQ